MNITITEYPNSWGAYTIGTYNFPAFKAADVLLIDSFSSGYSPPIMISSRVPWCSHKTMNGV